jgi:hypothetical protein
MITRFYFFIMRKLLAKDEGHRKKFKALFKRFGKKVNYRGYSEMTVLLASVTDHDTAQVVADHVWFAYTRGFEKAGIKEGEWIEFEARVKNYSKGYVNKALGIDKKKQDYKLSHPTRIKILKQG